MMKETQEPIVRGVTYLDGADEISGHNIIGFDIPVYVSSILGLPALKAL
jgi:hypothetical protein